jgi:hypothetical protein
MRGCGQPFERTASLMTAIVGSLPPRLFAAAFIAGVAALLAACDPITNSLACVAVKGANDSVTGEVRCPLMVASRTQSGAASPSAMRAIVPRTFDPSLLRIRLAGTNIPLTTTAGRLTVTLYQGPMPVASNVFTWSKSGTDLVAANPSKQVAARVSELRRARREGDSVVQRKHRVDGRRADGHRVRWGNPCQHKPVVRDAAALGQRGIRSFMTDVCKSHRARLRRQCARES